MPSAPIDAAVQHMEMELGGRGAQQPRKQTNAVKTEYSLPSVPGDDIMHRLDMELGRRDVQQKK